MTKNDETRYQCDICKLHYEYKIDVEKCHEWCSVHNSCNLEVASKSHEASINRRSFDVKTD
jgi:hypothetical protein